MLRNNRNLVVRSLETLDRGLMDAMEKANSAMQKDRMLADRRFRRRLALLRSMPILTDSSLKELAESTDSEASVSADDGDTPSQGQAASGAGDDKHRSQTSDSDSSEAGL